MNASKVIGIILIIGGIFGLSVGGFSFTKQTEQAKLGPLVLTTTEKETVNIPLWASLAAIAAGAGLLMVGTKKS